LQIINAEFVKSIIPKSNNILKLARGGQKLVFKASHEVYGDVAIKFVSDADDERIKREIEILTDHSFLNVPKLYEWEIIEITDEKYLYIIEEFINGRTLRQILNFQKILPLKLSLELMKSLLLSVAELEKHHLVHRDIKPENIIIRNDGEIFLLDFGIARNLDKSSITFTNSPFGPHTPGYSAPEQFRNMKKDIDSRCDLFSIGVVAYEAINGKHPFIDISSGHPLDILNKTETVIPNTLMIQGDTQKQLAGFISILMDKFPTRRPKNAETALKWFMALLPTLKIEEA
jgi:eukaryotic-like serine/threonine-protein kinase